MKQARTTRTSTATKQVKRVVATIALATAAGTATAPAFAADHDSDRGGDGIGRAFGSDRPGAKFGGAERGVEVKDDGTVEVRPGGLLGGAGDLVSDVVDGAGDVVEDVTEDVVDEPADVVEDVTETVDTVTDPVEDVVEDVTGAAPKGEQEQSGKGAEGDAPGNSEGKGRGSGTETGSGTDAGKASGSGEKAEAEPVKDAHYFASADIDYSADAKGLAPETPVAVPADGVPVSGELVAFEATAKALGFGPETLSGDREPSGDHEWSEDFVPSGDSERSGDYEPRHMKSESSHGGEQDSSDMRQATESSGPSMSLSSSDLLAGIGIGSVDLQVFASDEGVDLRVGAGDVKAEVTADRRGVSVDAGVPRLADVSAGADAQGVEAYADAAGLATVDAEVAVTGDAADGADDAGARGVEQDVSGLAERGGQPPLQNSAYSYLGQDARDALASSGAQFLSYQPTAVDQVAEDADAATREATIDAPLRVATTGTEAAALTGLAGALVVGGAGALLLANRTGRNGEPVPVKVRNTTS
ncbi:hypothetical protein GCM10027059_03820 [Myceligenerans halotolerans]